MTREEEFEMNWAVLFWIGVAYIAISFGGC
jgi:hypothetical protein